MSTMSSSRDRRSGGAQRFLTVAIIAPLAVLAFTWHGAAHDSLFLQVAPDAPRPARLQPAPTPPPSRPYARTTVELKAVVVRSLDEAMRALAGAAFLKRATAPIYIQVQTAEPLGTLDRSASPVILLNGERLLDTRATAQDRLVAFLPDRQRIKGVNTVEVVWLGDQATRTKKPLSFRREDVER